LIKTEKALLPSCVKMYADKRAVLCLLDCPHLAIALLIVKNPVSYCPPVV
jgi:hypothetical protein